MLDNLILPIGATSGYNVYFLPPSLDSCQCKTRSTKGLRIMVAAPKGVELVLHRSQEISYPSEPCGYELALPPKAAVFLGLIFAAIAMGIVTVQVAVYSHRFWKEQKLAVLIVNGVFLYTLISLAFLGEAVYRWLIVGFHDGNLTHGTVAQRYTLVMIPAIISRSIVSCFLGLVVASLFHSGLIALVIHMLTASELGVMTFVVHATYKSFGSKPTIGKLSSPLLKVHNSIAVITEGLGFILFYGTIFQTSRKKEGRR
ncbi:hypothetical protein DL93DRAFT_512550 [Clavulina sp. PMI_390]|nr:hypothetical protein DL93DRAFT_512550 [Clavulina sp. PMI_390]